MHLSTLAMDVTFESLKQQLQSEDFGDRLRALASSRSLPVAERYELAAMAANDSNPRVRYDAVSQLSSLGACDRERTFALLRYCLLEDPEIDVRAAAADALGALKFRQAFDTLRTVYTSTNDWLLQFSVIAALGEMGEPQAFELLADALHHANDLVRMAAIGALGDLGDPRALDLLLPLQASDDWQVRHRLVQALSRFDDPSARTALQQFARDPAEQVAALATQLLA